MRFVNFDFKLLRHDESGQAIVTNHYHIRRTMNLCELIIITEGTLYIHQKENIPVHAGEICILPPNEEHYGYASSNFKMHWSHFYLPEDYSITNGAGDSNVCFPLHFKPERIDRIILLANLLESYERTEETQAVRDGVLTAILAEVSTLYNRISPSERHGKRFHTIINFIISSLDHNTSLDVRTIAETFGYNEKYLYYLFRKHLNVTPHRYITDRKMSIAAERLLNTTDTVSSIATALSYESPQHFMKAFKKHFGMTPSQFRNQHLTKVELFFDDRNK